MKFIFRSAGVAGLNILNGLIETSYLAIIVTVPLWFAYWWPTYHVFELNKFVLFQILIWLLLLFTLLKAVIYPAAVPWPTRGALKKYWLPPAVFIIGLSLTLIWSTNIAQSFYGNPAREQGLLSYLFYALWFVLLSFNLWPVGRPDAGVKEVSAESAVAKKIERLVGAAVITGSAVSAYAVLQFLNIDFLYWLEAPYLTQRSFATFGQPNFLASWLLLVLPLSAYLFFRGRSFWLKSVWAAAFILQLIALWLTGSRAGIIAALIVAAAGLLYWLTHVGWPHRRKIWLALALIFLALVAWVVSGALAGPRWSRAVDINYGSTGARWNFYLAALATIPERPLFGYGLENSQEIFIRYYAPDWGVYGEVSQVADRAHNLILDILLTTGIFGLVLFSVLYGFFFYLARRNIRQRRSAALSLALALGAAAYLISLLFGFSILTGEIYFWLFLALLVVLSWQPGDGRSVVPAAGGSWRRHSGRLLATVVVIIIIAWQANCSLRTLIADFYFQQSVKALADQDYFTALTIYGYLTDLRVNPANQEFYDLFLAEQLSQAYPDLAGAAVKNAARNKLMEISGSLSRTGYRQLLVQAEIARALRDYPAAGNYLDQLVALAPQWPPVYLARAGLALAEGDQLRALLNYYHAGLVLPEASDRRLNEEHRRIVLDYRSFLNRQMAAIYQLQGRYAAAAKYYREAYRANPDDLVLLKQVADAYYLAGDQAAAISYIAHGLARDPGDYHWSLALAALYYETGDRPQARIYLERAGQLAPAEPAIQALRQAYDQ
ncbi:MAG: O-antigen ligase family protein [Patescibacteria group bacterium]